MKIMRLALLGYLLFALVGCGATTPRTVYHQTAVVDNLVVSVLHAVVVGEQATYEAGAYDVGAHKAHVQQILGLLEKANDITVVLLAWNPDDPMPDTLVEVGNTLRTLLIVVQDFLPANNQYVVALTQAIGVFTKGQ